MFFFYYLAPNPALAAKRGHVRVSSLDFKVNNQQQQQQPHPQYQQQHQYQHEEVYDKSQVVAVGTPLPTLNMPPNVTQSQVMVSRSSILVYYYYNFIHYTSIAYTRVLSWLTLDSHTLYRSCLPVQCAPS